MVGDIELSIWRSLKNAFIPWNLIRSSAPNEREGTRHVDYGQLLIDGTTGDIADMSRIVGGAEAAATAKQSSDVDPKNS